MSRNYFLLLAIALLGFGCASSPDFDESGPEVGPVAQVLDGDEDADPLAATIDLSNEAAGDEMDNPYLDGENDLGLE